MIKAILFDGYGTLFNEGQESIPRIAIEIVNELNLQVSAEELFQEWKRMYLILEDAVVSGKHDFMTIKEINVVTLDAIFRRLRVNGAAWVYVERLFELWRHPSLFTEVINVLEQLIDYKIGLVSNSDTQTLRSAVQHTGLIFDYVLSSEEAGSYKPNVSIFEAACNDLGLTPEAIIYVGNSLVDIIGAKKSGLHMTWVNRRNIPIDSLPRRPDFEVKSLDDLPILVCQMNIKHLVEA